MFLASSETRSGSELQPTLRTTGYLREILRNFSQLYAVCFALSGDRFSNYRERREVN